MADIVIDTPKTKNTYSWIRYIHQRISQNKNFLCITTGPTGSGKSWASLSIAEMLDKNFSAERVVFTGEELMNLINSGKLKKGSVIVWDEAGIDISSRSWQSTTNKLLSFLFQTFRHRNIILLFTTPYASFVDKSTRRLFHAEFRTESINFSNKTTKIRPKNWQYNDKRDQFYEKYLRRHTEFGVTKITYWDVPKPSKELIEAYELKKTAFTDALNEQIMRELKVQREKKSSLKRPTAFQQKILDLWNEGIKNQTEIGKRLGKTQQHISQNVIWLRNKGYDLYTEKTFCNNRDTSLDSTRKEQRLEGNHG